MLGAGSARGVSRPHRPSGEAGSNVRSSTAEREPRTSVLWPARHGRYEKCHQAGHTWAPPAPSGAQQSRPGVPILSPMVPGGHRSLSSPGPGAVSPSRFTHPCPHVSSSCKGAWELPASCGALGQTRPTNATAWKTLSRKRPAAPRGSVDAGRTGPLHGTSAFLIFPKGFTFISSSR